MSKHTGPKSTKTVEQDAMQIALGLKRPGQTKEQTRLIARGIQKGIEQYKTKQKTKARELNKQRKRKRASERVAPTVVQSESEEQPVSTELREPVQPKSARLAWSLLALTWLGIVAYAILGPIAR